VCEGFGVASVDAFGHKQLSGTGKALEYAVKNELGCKVRSIELNLPQRCAAHVASATDLAESVCVGRAAVKAAGEGLTYKWYYKNKNCQDFAVSGFKGNMYSLTMNEYCNGRQVYCVITDQYGNSVKTDIAVLHKAESDN
jgi:hypothetical protein